MLYTDYVNVFHGNGEMKLNSPEGLAGTWFFVKAQSGNTVPHAVLPFGKMSVGAYSGAYPCGYGVNNPNYCGYVTKKYDEKCFRGFSHIHHSGTGGIGYFYNYALTSAFYDNLENAFKMQGAESENARPGYYSVLGKDNGIKCEATVTENGCALHRYTFDKNGGKIAVDFAAGGLEIPDMESISDYLNVKMIDSKTAVCSVRMEGLVFHFAVCCKQSEKAQLFMGKDIIRDAETIHGNGGSERVGVCFDTVGVNSADVVVAYSLKSPERALGLLECDRNADFDKTAHRAEEIWNDALCKIEIDADEDFKNKFYSNLYHSFVKPSDLKDESFLYDDTEAFFSDFTTMWDIYKTQLPLVFALFPEETKQISETLVRTTEALGISSNCLSLTKRENVEDNQARGLTALVLMQAHLCGLDGVGTERVLCAMTKDIFHERNNSFLEKGVCERYTHILDLSDACHSAAILAKETGKEELSGRLDSLSANFVNAYDKETGILSDKSEYYEGSKYNYSFRLCHDMDKRIELAGGKERFEKLLSDFFGYGKEPVNQVFDPKDSEYVRYGLSLGRFEGFNNEPDMETPYSFIYADRHDKLCEIVHAGNKYMFTQGDGAVPGNNDSGAMSSCFVWNSLGLFPECGRDRVLVGSPCVKGAKIHLSSGNDFEISTSGEGIYVKKALLNGRELEKMYFPLTEMMKGGKLEIELKMQNAE